MMKVAGIPKYAEWVPIKALDHLREYDRRPGETEGADPEYWEQLKQHISQYGFEDPITLEYNPTTGKGYIGEGNHRLQVAQELGHTHVPTMIYRTSWDGENMKPMHEPGTYRMENQYGHMQFPQYAKPSMIGLPVSDEPYEAANEGGSGPNNWYDQRRSNILDPIATELPPSVWDHPASPEPTLKPIHAHWITTHIYEILERGGYTKPHEWLKLYMTGSLCTYQYSDSSDVDVSLFVDAVSLPEWSRAEMIGLMIKGVEGLTLPGTPYELQGYVVSRNLTPSDLYRPGLRAGYDIATHRWISPPDRGLAHDVKAQENGSYVYALEVADKMHKLLEYEPSKAVLLWHQIHRKRAVDEKMGKGDFAESNLAYKMLFKRGLVPQIAEVSGEHIAMAADPQWWEQYKNKTGDLWHGTDLLNLPSIMTHGLLPWDDSRHPSGSPWSEEDPQYEPRPGHVYLTYSPNEAAKQYSNVGGMEGTPIALKVDPAALHPESINPDEDLADQIYSRDSDNPESVKQLRKLFWGDPEDVSHRVFNPKSLGEYAEQVGWGNDPNDTRWAVERTGIVAHRGHISPEAITPHIQDKNMQWVPLPKADWGASSLEDLEHMYAKVADWTGPGDVSLTTQPAQTPMQEGPFSPYANVKQWQVNIGWPSNHYSDPGDMIRNMMFRNHPEIPFQIQEGKGGWAGVPEKSMALHLYDTPHDQMQDIMHTVGRHLTDEEMFGIMPQGYESGTLWPNPYHKSKRSGVASRGTSGVGPSQGSEVIEPRFGSEPISVRSDLPDGRFSPSPITTSDVVAFSPFGEQEQPVAFGSSMHGFSLSG